MKLFPLAIFIALIVAMSACKKSSNTFSLAGIQGTWAPNCGCTGLEYEFKGDSIFSANNFNNFVYTGYVRNDTAFLLCDYCGQIAVYFPERITLTNNNQKLNLGEGQCSDTSCTDRSYRRVH